MTATFFWNLFSQTGSIDAYLAYRQIPPATSPS
ncbi:MAG: YqzL family protein [Candidatus Tumulicola sp.]